MASEKSGLFETGEHRIICFAWTEGGLTYVEKERRRETKESKTASEDNFNGRGLREGVNFRMLRGGDGRQDPEVNWVLYKSICWGRERGGMGESELSRRQGRQKKGLS